MKKVIAYLRVSTASQIDKDGLKRQEDTIKAHCNIHNLELVDVIADKGISGTTYNREGLAKVFTHPVKSVIIEKLDRLGRDLLVSEKIIHEMKSKGIELVSCKEGNELLDEQPSRTLIRQMMNSIAEYEKSTICERLKLARERIRRDTGKCEGEKRLDEVKPEVIKELKRLRRKTKGMRRRTYEEISCIMNENGYSTKRDLPFTGVNVSRIMNTY